MQRPKSFGYSPNLIPQYDLIELDRVDEEIRSLQKLYNKYPGNLDWQSIYC